VDARALLFLLQEEVARRLAAQPGSPDRGALSAIVQAVFEVRLLRKVGPKVFWPRPKVRSRLVKLAPRVFEGDLRRFEQFVHALFAQPRRMALNSLISGSERLREPLAVQNTAELREKITGIFRAFGIERTARPGRLNNSQITTLFENLCRKH
jgi:16S rRNA A1518/A1519 N6-dimethyltransferase RsmA/KsgA/DIM1 with predicted DNA glycosylase/AP lyase activity